jgi:hypothetical protein
LNSKLVVSLDIKEQSIKGSLFSEAKKKWKQLSRGFLGLKKFENIVKRKLEALLSLSQCKMRTRRQRTYFFKFVFSNSAHDHVCPPEQQRAGGGLFLLVAWQVRAFCLNFLKSPPLVAAPLRCLKQI